MEGPRYVQGYPSFQQAQDIATLKQMQKRLEQMSSLQEVFQDSNSKIRVALVSLGIPKNRPPENERMSPKKWKMMEKKAFCSFMISSSRHLFTLFPLRIFSRFWVSFCINQEMDKGDINAVSLADLEDALQQKQVPLV